MYFIDKIILFSSTGSRVFRRGSERNLRRSFER